MSLNRSKRNKIGHLTITKYTFERVHNFKYLAVILNKDNKHQIDLQEKIKTANRTYFMLQKCFRNKSVSRKLRLRLNNTIIDKSLTYTSETWILTKRDRKRINIFERKVYIRGAWVSVVVKALRYKDPGSIPSGDAWNLFCGS